MKRWTEEELEYLRAQYAICGAQEIARRLGRSVKAVYSAAAVEGLCRGTRRSGTWTSAQEATLERLYGRMSAADIAQRVGHSRRAVQQRAYALRLTRARPDAGWMTAAQAARVMGMTTDGARKRLERSRTRRKKVGRRVYYKKEGGI